MADQLIHHSICQSNMWINITVYWLLKILDPITLATIHAVYEIWPLKWKIINHYWLMVTIFKFLARKHHEKLGFCRKFILFLSLIFVSSFYSCIPVPPIIEPFSFQDGLAEGMRTRTVCGVSRGDAPLALRWLKDGEPLPLLLGVNITSLDQYSSLLSIPSLSASHSGDYTCVASNPAAEIKYTASLQVKGIV